MRSFAEAIFQNVDFAILAEWYIIIEKIYGCTGNRDSATSHLNVNEIEKQVTKMYRKAEEIKNSKFSWTGFSYIFLAYLTKACIP